MKVKRISSILYLNERINMNCLTLIDPIYWLQPPSCVCVLLHKYLRLNRNAFFFIQTLSSIPDDVLGKLQQQNRQINISRPAFLYARHTSKFVKVTPNKINALAKSKQDKYGKSLKYLILAFFY